MDSLLLGSFPKASVMTSGRNSWRSRSYTKGCYASSYLRTASWQNAWKVQNDIQITRFFQNNNKGMGRGYTCPKSARKYIVNAASEQSFESEPGAYDPKNIWHSVTRALDAFYRFSRPHTVIGTALSILSVSLLAVEKLSDLSPLFFTGVLQAVVAALFMNIYIVGLNQLSDVEIDKINKPYLPLASGEYSFVTGVAIVASFSVLSFWLGWIVGSWPLFWALFISFVLGTAYSINLPMLRWKRFAVIAAMCILAVRAVIVQLAFFLHIQTHVFKRPALFSRPLVFATGFMSFFSVVIALFKTLKEIKYLASNRFQYVWVKSGYSGFVSHFLKWLMELPSWWELHLLVFGAKLLRVLGMPSLLQSSGIKPNPWISRAKLP
ncbi:homogentisate phytyltransferase 1, chloroplastic isoform X2 [Prosopis cineraria]|uniref:homogentisate phytyltransferase 1, chloroplastic isoform X2 n=1 Tax=Prosopis cineraria TaxID=364024 RepID=UPI00240F7D86|nr:homogentisate phytyltransferase 1, chloroplastic isoform X2 [Prosopis cineraria]